MNAIIQTKQPGGALVTAEQADAMRTALKSSLYPGASDASIDLVLAYCRAGGYDPMRKPVHIVPMKVATGRKDDKGWDIKETRDVIMPGIGQYRTDAVRTGVYAGCSEPEFGPTKTLTFKREQWVDGDRGGRVKRYVDAELSYPEWCKVTITKIVDNQDRQFTAKEYWLENYAEKGDSGAPNSMWEKRPFAQLAKCTEAQALRKAFPEAVGAQPTAEEMEGRDVIDSTATVVASQPAALQLPQPYPDELFATNLPTWRGAIAAGKKSADEIIAMVETRGRLSDAQKADIRRQDKPKPNPDFPLPGDDAEADPAQDAEGTA